MHKLLFIFLSLCLNSMAIAGTYSFLDSAPIGSFTDEDITLMKNNIYKALDTVEDGKRLRWKNNKTDHAGLANPLKTYMHNKMKCRTLRIINRSKTQIAQSTFEFCKTNNNEWKIVSKKQ